MGEKESPPSGELKQKNFVSGYSLTREEFYNQLIVSSSKFIDPSLQEKFRSTNILIVGAGSVGNPIAMMAVRSGAENITVMDPDVVEVNNLSRQQYNVKQIGKNKADMTLENMKLVNPFIEETSRSNPSGMTLENAREYVENSDIVVDAVDIRSLDIIYYLHKYAKEYRKPVLVGYDLAGTAMVAVYRYDKEEMDPLMGELTEEKIWEFKSIQDAYEHGRISQADFLNYVYDAFTGPIKPLNVPVEQLEEIIGRDPEDSRTYQLGSTSTVLSVLSVEAMRRIVAGESIKDVILVDIPSEVRRSNPGVMSRIPLLLRTLSVLKTRAEGVKEILNKIS